MKKRTGAQSAMAELLSKGNETQKQNDTSRSTIKSSKPLYTASQKSKNQKPQLKTEPAQKKRMAPKKAQPQKRVNVKQKSKKVMMSAFSLAAFVKKPALVLSAVFVCAGLLVAALLFMLPRTQAASLPDASLGADAETTAEIAAEAVSIMKAAEKDESETRTAASGRYTVTFAPFGEEDIICTTSSKTVDELLTTLNIQIAEDQILRAERTDVINEDTVISIDKLTYGTVTENEPVAFDTQYVDIQTIKRGTTQVTRDGVNGTKAVNYAVTYVNGVEYERVYSSEYIVTQPVSQIVRRGVGGTVTVGGRSYSYSYYIDCSTSVYTGGGTTASGLPATEAVISVDPSVIPLGTKCYVADSYTYVGIRTAADTGGSIKGNKIDIYLNESNPSLAGYGRRSARVYILG